MPMSFGGVSKQKVATIIVAADGSGDTTDIQTGINMLPAGGGVVYIKEGTYTITLTITIMSDNIEIHGAGNSSIIKRDASLTESLIDLSDGSTAVKGVRIMNLQLDGNRVSYSSDLYGIHLRGNPGFILSNIAIENCYIHHTGGNGIKSYLIDGLTILTSTFSYCYDYGLYLASSGFILSNCFINHSGRTGVSVDIGFAATGAVKSSIIDSNYIYSNGYSGIYLTADYYCIVSNNVVSDNNQVEGTSCGILIAANSDRNIVTGNLCIDTQGTSTQDRGIYILDANCNNNILTSNVCVGNVTAQITDSGTGTVTANNVET